MAFILGSSFLSCFRELEYRRLKSERVAVCSSFFRSPAIPGGSRDEDLRRGDACAATRFFVFSFPVLRYTVPKEGSVRPEAFDACAAFRGTAARSAAHIPFAACSAVSTEEPPQFGKRIHRVSGRTDGKRRREQRTGNQRCFRDGILGEDTVVNRIPGASMIWNRGTHGTDN